MQELVNDDLELRSKCIRLYLQRMYYPKISLNFRLMICMALSEGDIGCDIFVKVAAKNEDCVKMSAIGQI